VTYNFATKEELFEFVEENQESKSLGMTIDDFNGIDIDDFVKSNFILHGEINAVHLKNSLEYYIFQLKVKELEPYVAKELINIESSTEEFEAFKDTYFENLNITYEFLYVDEYGIENYDFTVDDKTYWILIGQTQSLKKEQTSTEPDGSYLVIYYGDPSRGYPMTYSKNRKYFILSNMLNDDEYNFIKTFCEIED
jgi:hypothetical protein